MRRTCILVCTALLVVSLVHLSIAATIDFESRPDGSPTTSADDDQPIGAPYAISGGGTVRFFFDNNGNNTFDAGDDDALFEQVGTDGNEGFSSSFWGGSPDLAAPPFGPQLGNYFLRGVTPGAIPPPFIVDYNTAQTITELSGEIWDIDGQSQATELWLVEVLDGANNVLTSQYSPLGDSLALDSRPWTFAFTGLPVGVDKIRITFQGTKPNGTVGLAFNNFSPTIALPEPSSIALLVVGLAPLGVLIARRRRRA